MSATFAAGFLGIKEKIEPTSPTEGAAYFVETENRHKVPTSLLEAANLFKKSEAARSIWGNKFVDHFSSTRAWEYEQYVKNKPIFERDSLKVSNWELDRYFEII